MSQTTLYASVLAKIGAERSKLLSEAKIKTLSESKNLTEIASQLRDTTYQEQIAKGSPPLTNRKLERALYENLIETYQKIIKNSPKNAAQYLNLYLLSFEVENIKALIKGTVAKLTFEQKLSKIYLSAEDYLKKRAVMEEVVKAQTLHQIVNTFKGTDYWSALSIGLKSYEETSSTTGFDVSLDKFFYEKVCSSYMSLSKKEKQYAKFYASMAVDSFTLLTLLRGKNLNYDANWLRLTVPSKCCNLSLDTVEALVSADDFESALKIALESHYGKFFVKSQNPEDTIGNAEKAFKKAVLQSAKSKVVRETFNIGASLAFMVQKEAEVRNLVALSSGVDSELKFEDIRNQLLL